MQGIPTAKDTDAEDVAWGLQTADTLWRRGDCIDALVWLRRAAEAAGAASDDDRALELARSAAELTDWVAAHPSGQPPSQRRPQAPPLRTASPSTIDTAEPFFPAPRPIADTRTDEEEARPSTASVLPAYKVHAGMLNPWDDGGLPSTAPPPPPTPSRLPDGTEEEVVTSVNLRLGHFARLLPAEALANEARSSAWGEPPEPEPPIDPAPAKPAPKVGAKPPPLPSRARKTTPPPPKPARMVPESSETLGPPPRITPPPPSPTQVLPRPGRVARWNSRDDEDEQSAAGEHVGAAVDDGVEPGDAAARGTSNANPEVYGGFYDELPETARDRQLLAPNEEETQQMQATDPRDLETVAPPALGHPLFSGYAARALADRPVVTIRSSPPPPHNPPPTAVVAPSEETPELDLDDVEAFADLPDDARRAFAAAAHVTILGAGDEVSQFALAYVMDGSFEVSATMVDAPAARIETGAVLRSRGTIGSNVPLRLIGVGSGVVATWSDVAVSEAFRSCPWVEEDLRTAADRWQVLAGITIGPLGERLDMTLREEIVGRLTMQKLAPGEIVAKAGETVPGVCIVGVGELELLDGETVKGSVSSGDFLFPGEVIGAGAAPQTARVGAGGALVLSGDRMVAQELLVTCPPLLEIFAGM